MSGKPWSEMTLTEKMEWIRTADVKIRKMFTDKQERDARLHLRDKHRKEEEVFRDTAEAMKVRVEQGRGWNG